MKYKVLPCNLCKQHFAGMLTFINTSHREWNVYFLPLPRTSPNNRAHEYHKSQVSNGMYMILYGQRIILQYIYIIQQDTQCFMIKFIHNIW